LQFVLHSVHLRTSGRFCICVNCVCVNSHFCYFLCCYVVL
jgi:hypothetical protein